MVAPFADRSLVPVDTHRDSVGPFVGQSPRLLAAQPRARPSLEQVDVALDDVSQRVADTDHRKRSQQHADASRENVIGERRGLGLGAGEIHGDADRQRSVLRGADQVAGERHRDQVFGQRAAKPHVVPRHAEDAARHRDGDGGETLVQFGYAVGSVVSGQSAGTGDQRQAGGIDQNGGRVVGNADERIPQPDDPRRRNHALEIGARRTGRQSDPENRHDHRGPMAASPGTTLPRHHDHRMTAAD